MLAMVMVMMMVVTMVIPESAAERLASYDHPVLQTISLSMAKPKATSM